MPNSSQRQTMANAIRALAIDAVQAANSGHPGMPMGMADAATALFCDHLNLTLQARTGQTVIGLCCQPDMDQC